MAIDVLQDVLSTIRLNGNHAGVYTFAAPWGFAISPKKGDMIFLMILQGNAVLEIEEEDIVPQSLQSGDIVVLPWGSSHTLRDSWHTPVRQVTTSSMLSTYAYTGGQQTRLVSGCYTFIDGGLNPLFSVLPPLIFLHKEEYQPTQDLDLLMRLFTNEAEQEEACQPIILTRLAEVLFLRILRLYASRTLESKNGWLTAFTDPAIATALQEIHTDPAAPWTVALLAEKANLSRSAFAERFSKVVGEPPLHYIQRWRMQRAAHLLSEEKLPLKTVISMSGYASEAAFRKAFQRWLGVLPGHYESQMQESQN